MQTECLNNLEDPWEDDDFPPAYLIQKADSKSATRACERLLDSSSPNRVEDDCKTKTLYTISDEGCKGFPANQAGTGYSVMEEAVKNDLQVDSNYEVTAETVSRCAPINLFNQYLENLQPHHLHYENQNKRVCYLAEGTDESPFKAEVCDKLHVETVNAGTVTFKCGATCVLTPAEGMAVFDFNYNAADGSIGECHLGHGVKNLVMAKEIVL